MSRGRARADEDKDLKGKDESDGGEEGGGGDRVVVVVTPHGERGPGRTVATTTVMRTRRLHPRCHRHVTWQARARVRGGRERERGREQGR